MAVGSDFEPLTALLIGEFLFREAPSPDRPRSTLNKTMEEYPCWFRHLQPVSATCTWTL